MDVLLPAGIAAVLAFLAGRYGFPRCREEAAEGGSSLGGGWGGESGRPDQPRDVK